MAGSLPGAVVRDPAVSVEEEFFEVGILGVLVIGFALGPRGRV